MKINIILTYRPSFYSGGLTTAATPMFQDETGIWKDEVGTPWQGENVRNELETAIRAINKNSVYRHNIILAVDKDIFPNEKWLQKFGNVSIFRSDFDLVAPMNPVFRSSAAIKQALFSLPDDAFVTNYYISDIVCAKYWDKYIEEAYVLYGDGWVYAPMFVEPRSPESCGMTHHCGDEVAKRLSLLLGEVTTDKIWNQWRRLCCHSLTIPPYTEQTYIPEKYFDEWIAIASQYPISHIQEHHGYRNFGYWVGLCGRNKVFKRAFETVNIGPGFDTNLDAKIANKLVVTHSFLLHAHNEVRLDDIEVEKIS